MQSTEKEKLLEGNLRKLQRWTPGDNRRVNLLLGLGRCGFLFVVVIALFFETGSFYVAQIGLDFVVILPSPGITGLGVHHCAQLIFKHLCVYVYPHEFVCTIPMQRPEKVIYLPPPTKCWD